MKQQRERGFSMLELIAISAIVAVIAAIAIPNAVSARRSYVLLGTAEALSQQLSRCRREAVRVNDRVSIKVFANKTIINLDRNEDFDENDGSEFLFGEGVVTEFAPSSGEVEYTSRGELPIGATVSFTVAYSGNKRVVTVEQRGAPIIGPELPA